MNIQEDFVSFETAKLLKEKGFDIPCDNYYDSSGETPNESIYGGASIETLDYNADPFVKSGFPKFKTFSAPTLQMAMKWLREVHHYIIEIYYGNVGSLRKPEMQWWWELENKQGEFLDGNITDGNTTYEEACKAAIKYCLENLI